MRGYLHLYTGDGKGKTTAAIGLAIRAIGAGKRVYFAQFVKGMRYSELEALKRFEEEETLLIKVFGRECFIEKEPTEADIVAAQKGLNEVREVLKKGEYQLVVLDEATIAIHYNLFSEEQLIEIIEERTEGVEVVVTGRYATQKLINYADLVTEMKELKHYYQLGVISRKGIEF